MNANTTIETLKINADVGAGGMLRVALLEADGRAIPGYEIEHCAPLVGDETRWTARWSGGSKVPTDRPVRVRIELRNARLYSVGH